MIKVNSKHIPLTKDQFVDAINDIKEYQRKLDNIQSVLEENCEESIFWPPSLESTLINVLSMMFNDENDNIGYFIYDLNFGEYWEPGYITDVDGTDIKMQTAENLYDYLVNNL